MLKSRTTPPSSYPTSCLSFPTGAPQPGKAGMGVQTFACGCDTLTQVCVCPRVPGGPYGGPLPPSPLRAGLDLPRDPPWAPPAPLLRGGVGGNIPPSRPYNKKPLSPCWDGGGGGLSGSGSRRDPPLPVLPTSFRTFKLCQRPLPRGCRALLAASPARRAALPPQPPPMGAGVSPNPPPPNTVPLPARLHPIHTRGGGWILDAIPVCSEEREGGGPI